MEFTYRDQVPGVPAGDFDYTVTVRTESAGDAEYLHIELAATHPDGSQAMNGTMSLPPSALPATRQVLGHVFDGLESLVCRVGQPASTPRRVRANAGAPWTAQLRQQLRQAWLAEDPVTPANQTIVQLANTMGRSRYAIRSQLPRVNCDPDIPGRELSTSTPDWASDPMTAAAGPGGGPITSHHNTRDEQTEQRTPETDSGNTC